MGGGGRNRAFPSFKYNNYLVKSFPHTIKCSFPAHKRNGSRYTK